jgi:SAM-dependent methyltransferase
MSDQTSDKSFDPAAYWEERLSTRFTLGSTGWLSLGEGFNRWMYAVRRHAFTRFVPGVVGDPASLRVLDVGSGTGFYLDRWRQLGARDVTSCDLTSAAVERLRASFPELTVVKSDIGGEAGQLPPGSYDAVSVIDVLYHIVDDDRYRRAFANLAGLLSPEGTLFFTENLVLAGHRVRHQVHRTRETIEEMVADAGLEVVGEQPFFFLMNDPVASNSRLLHAWWKLLSEAVVRQEAIGWAAGATLFPVELALTRIFRHGPSTTLLACRRR